MKIIAWSSVCWISSRGEFMRAVAKGPNRPLDPQSGPRGD